MEATGAATRPRVPQESLVIRFHGSLGSCFTVANSLLAFRLTATPAMPLTAVGRSINGVGAEDALGAGHIFVADCIGRGWLIRQFIRLDGLKSFDLRHQQHLIPHLYMQKRDPTGADQYRAGGEYPDATCRL